MLIVAVSTSMLAFNLPNYLESDNAYLWHIRFLSLSQTMFTASVIISVMRTTIICVAFAIYGVLQLNWVLSCWLFNPFEMGLNQVIFGYVLAIALIAIPMARILARNKQLAVKQKRDAQCKRDAASKYRAMKRQFDQMRADFDALNNKADAIEKQLNSI